MGFWSKNLRQDVTHWPVTGSDGFGGSTFGSPVLLTGRWQENAEQYRNALNEETISSAICYLDTDVSIGDYLAEGDYTTTSDPVTLNTNGTIARTIEQFQRSTDLYNLSALRKVYM